MTLVVYDPSEVGDVVLGLVVLSVLTGYMVLLGVRVLGGGYRVERVGHSKQSAVQWLLDPTHEVCDTTERWVRRNFYFVDGRSWPVFGVVEVAAGHWNRLEHA